jgi:hypothetical protein
MKQIIILIFFVTGVFLPFSGCKKFVDHIFHHDTTVVNNCRIAKIALADELGHPVTTGTVYYNEHNDPDSVILDVEVYGPTLFFFKYNDDHQLIEYRSDYDRRPGMYYEWHKYIYENGVIAHDTARIRIAGQWTEVRDIDYDQNGRVIKETRHVIELDHQPANEDLEPLTYAYDAFGNLAGANVVFDSKINFLRTNKVWMFTQKNYSVNNRPPAVSYNEFGLPLAFDYTNMTVFLIAIGVTSIEYECSPK